MLTIDQCKFMAWQTRSVMSKLIETTDQCNKAKCQHENQSRLVDISAELEMLRRKLWGGCESFCERELKLLRFVVARKLSECDGVKMGDPGYNSNHQNKLRQLETIAAVIG